MPDPPHLHIPDALAPALRHAFKKAWEGFTPLHGNPIYLLERTKGEVTMRAQPMWNAAFFSRKSRAYKIEFQPFPVLLQGRPIADLPDEVLVGWFAHELGHLMDYLRRPWYDLIKLG
ncbi:MAG: hypothetical protein KDC44_25155, partial [Phaeodactylibacter sp.]|nr:hypothetical protein [Phaeodactylibacter sp.]